MDITSSSLADFTGLLRLEIDTYRKLVPLLEEEKRALSRAHLGGLKENNKRIETLLVELRILEEARKGMVERFARELQIEAHTLTLLKLSESVAEPFATDLRSCHTALSTLLERLNELVKANAAIIEYSFRVNGSLITFLGSCMTDSKTYDSAGAFDEGPVKSSFLARKA